MGLKRWSKGLVWLNLAVGHEDSILLSAKCLADADKWRVSFYLMRVMVGRDRKAVKAGRTFVT